MSSYKMDRTAFKHQSFGEEEKTKVFKHLPTEERLRIANYLISVAYGFVGKPFPKMDKTAFSMRKRD